MTKGKTTLYLRADVRRRLQEHAERDDRSMSNLANVVLTAAFDAADAARAGERRDAEGSHD